MKRIGVLALQGAFIEHISMLRGLGAESLPVRSSAELAGLDGLVIPGGESTTMRHLLSVYRLQQDISVLIGNGLPIMGTCAGMILLAKKLSGAEQNSLGAMDIDVRRNAFGRQVDSFEADLDMPALGDKPFHAIFIRAPRIEQTGPRVQVLARLPDGPAVAARQENLLVAAFHPELTNDTRFHQYFLDMIS